MRVTNESPAASLLFTTVRATLINVRNSVQREWTTALLSDDHLWPKILGMSRELIDSILQTVRELDARDRITLADEVDRLAWRDRVQVVIDDIAAASRTGSPPDDAEIDAIVDQVRAEKSLYERYWTRRRQSAP
jgi:hypothetical protein